MTPKPRQTGAAEFVAIETAKQSQRQMFLTQYSILMNRREVALQNLKSKKPKQTSENTI